MREQYNKFILLRITVATAIEFVCLSALLFGLVSMNRTTGTEFGSNFETFFRR